MTVAQLRARREKDAPTIASRRVASQRSKPNHGWCQYCGRRCKERVCWAHTDLPELDNQAYGE